MALPLTPPKLNDSALRLIEREIGSLQQAIAVQIRTEPWSRASFCFENVQEKIAQDGGEMQLGWAVWTWPGVFVEAEFHSVWQHPATRRFWDVSPHRKNLQRIVFIPDSSVEFDPLDTSGRRIDNVRLALRPEPLIEKYLSTAKARADFVSQLPGFGDLHLEGEQADMYHSHNEQLAQLELHLAALYLKPSEPCVCGSGRSFHRCCQVRLSQLKRQ